jgi:small subunit ribosomal protein S5
MGLVDKPMPPPQELFRAYSEEEKALLAKKYTPEQIRAIEAGEAAIRPEDLDRQGVVRTDAGTLPYLDDFRHYRNVVDKRPQDETPEDPNTRFMTEEELGRSFSDYFHKLDKENPPPVRKPPQGGNVSEEDAEKTLQAGDQQFNPTRLNLLRADYEAPSYMGTNGPLPAGQSLLAPALPKDFSLDDTPAVKKEAAQEEDDENARDQLGVYKQLRKQTGLTMDDIMKLRVKTLVINYVTNQTRLGKIQSVLVLAIAGNGNGRLGVGQAKGQEMENTLNLARIAAIRNMQPVPRYEDRTVYGEVEGKVSAVKVQLMARPPGKLIPFVTLNAQTHGLQDLAFAANTSSSKWLEQLASTTSPHEYHDPATK